MPRFGNRPTLKTKKIETTWSNIAQNAGTTQTIEMVTAKNDPTTDREIQVGSRVRWIYLEFHFSAENIASTKVIHWQLTKNPGGQLTLQGPALYGTSVRKWIIKRGMEMLPKDTSTVFKRIFVARVPPKMRRFDEDDTFSFRYISSSTETINACGIAIINAEI